MASDRNKIDLLNEYGDLKVEIDRVNDELMEATNVFNNNGSLLRKVLSEPERIEDPNYQMQEYQDFEWLKRSIDRLRKAIERRAEIKSILGL